MSVSSRYTLLPTAHWQERRLRGVGACIRLLYLWLYGHPRMTSLGVLPGLRAALEAEFADMSGETLPAARRAWDQLVVLEMIRCDEQIVVVPARFEDDPPANPNIVKSWPALLSGLSGELLGSHLKAVGKALKARGQSFEDALKPLISKGKAARNGSANGIGERMAKGRRRVDRTDAEIRSRIPDPGKESGRPLPAAGGDTPFARLRDALVARGFEGSRPQVVTLLAKAKVLGDVEAVLALVNHAKLDAAAEPWRYLLGIIEGDIAKSQGKTRSPRGPRGRIDEGGADETLALRMAQEAS